MSLTEKAPLRIAAIMSWLFMAIKLCASSEYCDSKFNSLVKADSDQARILHGLASSTFSAESHSNGFNTEYSIRVCGNASKTDPLAGVLQNQTTVLGRVNNTSVVKGGDWMMMMFGSGDLYPEKHNCSGPRVAFVMIHCNHNKSSENTLRFIKETREEKNSCFFMFELHSQLVCVQPHKIDGSTIFFVILLSLFLGYFIGGFLYQRFVLGAKGLEQVPNLSFWKAVSNLAVGWWNKVCCKRPNISSNSWDNMDRRIERDDDSLLPP